MRQRLSRPHHDGLRSRGSRRADRLAHRTPSWSCSEGLPALARPRSPRPSERDSAAASRSSSRTSLRRVVLREHDVPGGLNIALIATVCRFSLDAGYHVILEGILTAARYGPMLRQLAADHRGRTSFFYFDVPFAETVRRHATRPQASEFTPEDMRGWYAASGRLDVSGEQVITATSSAEASVDRIMAHLASDERDASDV